MSIKSSETRGRSFVLRFRNSEIILGAKAWAIAALAAAIVTVGIFVTPTNGWAGAGVGVAGILGAVLGALFQKTPIPRDFTAEGASAVRGLHRIAEDVEDAQVLSTQLVDAADDNARIALGLVNIQDRLLKVRSSLYVSMSEWDDVAPGSVDEVNRLRQAGREALIRLSMEADDD